MISFIDFRAILEPIINEEVDSVAEQHPEIGIRSRELAQSNDGVMLVLGINVLAGKEAFKSLDKAQVSEVVEKVRALLKTLVKPDG